MNEIRAIDTIAESSLPLAEIAAEFGGKAAGLVRLRRSGVTTPPTWFVPPSVGVEAIDGAGLDPEVARWAVRSSGASEDGEQRSFAGLFSSELAVEPTAVPAAVARVRASGTNARLRAGYRFADPGPIPVVLQPFLDAALAGVWIGDGAGGGVLEWSSSGTDAVVAGTVTPSREVWRAGELVSERSERTIDTARLAHGGTERQRGAAVSGTPLHAEGRKIGARCLIVEQAVGAACDLEFCVHAGQLVWLQCRPVTARIPVGVSGDSKGDVVVSGFAAAGGVSTGRPRVMLSPEDEAWEHGDILVVRYTSIDWVPLMTEASAIVTDIGGGLSHAAIIARELGIPCVTGTETGTRALGSLKRVTVDGDAGKVRR
ncbi:PEP-utilizing enzyme [Nocardia lijiangensis]|uniref:PEP-utilizing enzyme n=1 Tax=Nocardia lijiangensis TaxID=299618 RepID=UPI00082CFEE2|nr:PEP-utilizing enzyme [Nocardia lijiangensis]